jgi:hypothetical protein
MIRHYIRDMQTTEIAGVLRAIHTHAKAPSHGGVECLSTLTS